MIVILSSNYVSDEMQAEVGKIPPCMLPIGNQKLLERQLASLREQYADPIFVTLPESHIITVNEQTILTTFGAQSIAVPDDMSLGQALHYALNVIICPDTTVRVLFGDALVEDLAALKTTHTLANNAPAVHPSIVVVRVESEQTQFVANAQALWCGYFEFADKPMLMRTLALTQGDFHKALGLYAKAYDIVPLISQKWHDFSHINAFFKARTHMTTQRAFNSITVRAGVLTKTGTPAEKIAAEAYWFSELPMRLRPYIPQLFEVRQSDASTAYDIEYLPLLPLNELFVHGRNPPEFWRGIFVLLAEFLQSCRSLDIHESARKRIKKETKALYKTKTLRRLKEYASQTGFDLQAPMRYRSTDLPCVADIAMHCSAAALEESILYAVMHGDLCFSNVLYDSRQHRLKVIDPRGMDESGNLTIFGDQKYDLAKLCHSVIGLYDFIIAGRYRLTPLDLSSPEINFDLDERIYQIQDDFMAIKLWQGKRFSSLKPITVLLFLSMLPLHADRPDRQQAMLVNALRLYHDWLQSLPNGAN